MTDPTPTGPGSTPIVTTKRLPRWLFRILVGTLVVALVLIGAWVLYQAIAT